MLELMVLNFTSLFQPQTHTLYFDHFKTFLEIQLSFTGVFELALVPRLIKPYLIPSFTIF